MGSTASTIDEYIAEFPEDVRAVLEKVRVTIHAAVPNGSEIISYQIPAFTVEGKTVVFFAGWAKHISVYPVPAGDTAFEAAIAPYHASKGTLKFLLAEPIPYDLIGRVAALLVAQRGLP